MTLNSIVSLYSEKKTNTKVSTVHRHFVFLTAKKRIFFTYLLQSGKKYDMI